MGDGAMDDIFINMVDEYAGDIERLTKENRKLKEHHKVLCNHVKTFCTVTGQSGLPVYASAVERNRLDPGYEVLHNKKCDDDDNNYLCSNVAQLLDAEVHIIGGNNDNEQHVYSVSEAAVITCADIEPGLEALLIISFGFADNIVLSVRVHVHQRDAQFWTDLDIQNPIQHPRQMELLRNMEIIAENGVKFSRIQWSG